MVYNQSQLGLPPMKVIQSHCQRLERKGGRGVDGKGTLRIKLRETESSP